MGAVYTQLSLGERRKIEALVARKGACQRDGACSQAPQIDDLSRDQTEFLGR